MICISEIKYVAYMSGCFYKGFRRRSEYYITEHIGNANFKEYFSNIYFNLDKLWLNNKLPCFLLKDTYLFIHRLMKNDAFFNLP